MGAKTDGSDTDSVTGLVQGPGRVISGAEEPMSDEEEDDDDRFSFTTTASAAKILAESDKTKDSSKYVLIIIIIVVIFACILIYLHTWQGNYTFNCYCALVDRPFLLTAVTKGCDIVQCNPQNE